MPNSPQSGYTLPVFATAAAKAAILSLEGSCPSQVSLDLLAEGMAEIAIAQVANIDSCTALGITISDPGDNLDLTCGTPIWAWVQLADFKGTNLILEAGMGLGHTEEGQPAIYEYARKLLETNLLPLLKDRTATIKFILPQGRQLAERTSNRAFGILEGLALLGTRGISQPLSAADKLEEFRADLQAKSNLNRELAFYIGANGYQVATKLGFSPAQMVQTANWIGVMLVEAALLNVKSLTLVGYHGKLLKLAGGIFNTSSHLADARQEILVAGALDRNFPLDLIHQIWRSPTAEAAEKLISNAGYSQIIFSYLAEKIQSRSLTYIHKYSGKTLELKVVLCDRLGKILATQNY
jgi:cobalt-precorrin-5B (C1)-methyltransferase